MKRYLTIAVILILAIGFSTCKKDEIEPIQQNIPIVPPCDTFVSYSESVAPILYTQCKDYHFQNSKYPDKSSLWFITENPASSADVIIDSLRSIGGVRLSKAINGELTGNLSVMPPSGKLDKCSIAIIEEWISAGMPE